MSSSVKRWAAAADGSLGRMQGEEMGQETGKILVQTGKDGKNKSILREIPTGLIGRID